MAIAKAVETGRAGVWHVFCAECFYDLETMATDTIIRAILLKGDLLCPECRREKELCLSSSPKLNTYPPGQVM